MTFLSIIIIHMDLLSRRAPRTNEYSSVPRRSSGLAKYFRSLNSLASHAVRVERQRRAQNSFSAWEAFPASCIGHTNLRPRTNERTNEKYTSLGCTTMTLLQMHATAYGFSSTGAKNFFGNRNNTDISERLVANTERTKFYCKVFDMSCKNVDNIQPSENDILLGRGGKNNQHSGNEKLRELARAHAKNYNSSTKKGKSILSRILVKQMRELDPPSR